MRGAGDGALNRTDLRKAVAAVASAGTRKHDYVNNS